MPCCEMFSFDSEDWNLFVVIQSRWSCKVSIVAQWLCLVLARCPGFCISCVPWMVLLSWSPSIAEKHKIREVCPFSYNRMYISMIVLYSSCEYARDTTENRLDYFLWSLVREDKSKENSIGVINSSLWTVLCKLLWLYIKSWRILSLLVVLTITSIRSTGSIIVSVKGSKYYCKRLCKFL